MSTSESIIGWYDPVQWHFRASEIVGEQASAAGAQQGTDQRRPPFGWDDPSLKWRSGASEIVAEQAAAEGTQQGNTAAPKRPPPFGWPEPWGLRATDVVSKEASTGETQPGTDPKWPPFGWYDNSLKWRSDASEIGNEEVSETPRRPPPLGWPEPWSLRATEIVSKEASVEGTQKTASN